MKHAESRLLTGKTVKESDIMRKLASIQRIWKIEPIEGADKIELAFVLGWQCVVNKGQFKPMDLAVYFEIDSFLPIRDEFEFLRISSYRKNDILGEGFRLKTMRFRGQISQGLLLPLGQFNELDACDEIGRHMKPGILLFYSSARSFCARESELPEKSASPRVPDRRFDRVCYDLLHPV